jgi:hypothetical protein
MIHYIKVIPSIGNSVIKYILADHMPAIPFPPQEAVMLFLFQVDCPMVKELMEVSDGSVFVSSHK